MIDAVFVSSFMITGMKHDLNVHVKGVQKEIIYKNLILMEIFFDF